MNGFLVKHYDKDTNVYDKIMFEPDLSPDDTESFEIVSKNSKIGEKLTDNDRYSSYRVSGSIPIKGTLYRLLDPSEKELNHSTRMMVSETHSQYLEKCQKLNSHNFQWIYNIIEKRSEQKSIIFENERFVAMPDFVWTDRTDISKLHVLAIVKDKEIMSIRDLRKRHIPLLEEMITEGTKIISEMYGLVEDHIKMFFHYPPSTYLLHMHFVNIGVHHHGTSFERCHDIYQVIHNLKVDDLYYTETMRISDVPGEH